jgi:murein DD-endopeptidase MepM/ murein hydrolase activator NlpD
MLRPLMLFIFCLLGVARADALNCEEALGVAFRLNDPVKTQRMVLAACGAIFEVSDSAIEARGANPECLRYAAQLDTAAPGLASSVLRLAPTSCQLHAAVRRPRLGVPLTAMPLTSGWGVRVHPVLHRKKMHTGLDLDAELGDPIGAHAAGAVVFAGRRGGYGNAVEIAHPSGLSTLYGHLSRIDVRVGDVVLSQQKLGLAGSTGMSTGPHLHFEVRHKGRPIDPRPYFTNPRALTAGAR